LIKMERSHVFYLGPICNKYLILDIIKMVWTREKALDVLSQLCLNSLHFLDFFKEEILTLPSIKGTHIDMRKEQSIRYLQQMRNHYGLLKIDHY